MATTHQDTNVNQLVINKMTKQEYDNLSQVSDTELYLVEEQVDSVVTQNSTNPVQSGAVYNAIQDIGSAINDGTTTFTKNNETIGTTGANQENDKTIALPNDVEMVYFAHSKALSVQTTDAYYDTNYNYLVEENPATWTDPNPQHRITTDGYYYDLLTDNIYQVDNYETTEVTSNVTIQGDTHKLYVDITTNKAYRWNGNNFVPVCESEKEIVDNLIIAKDDSNNWYAYPLVNTYIGIVNSTTPASFWDTKTSSLHTFTAEDSGKYFYDTVDNKVYVYITHNNSLYCCSDDGALYHLENLDTTKTYLSYNTKILYRTDNGEEFTPINSEVKFVDESGTYSNLPAAADNIQSGWTLSALFARIKKWFSSLKKVAFSGSYNDLTDTPQNATTTTAGLMSAEDKTYSTDLQSFGTPKIFSVATYKCILLADITTFWNSSSSTVNLPLQGFVGFAIKFRDGGNISNASADITAMVSYKNDGGYDHKILTTSNSKLTPHIVSYDNKIYITLDYGDVQNHYLKLLGTFHNCLSTPLQVNQSDCTLIE